MTYLAVYLKEDLLEGQTLFPGFATPPSMTHKQYMEYVEEGLEREVRPRAAPSHVARLGHVNHPFAARHPCTRQVPIAYGLHPNSEINFMTKQADDLCRAILELQPRGGGSASGLTLQEKVKRMLDDIVEKLPEQLSNAELEDRVTMEDRTPYTNVFLQEVDRMSKLLYEMRRSLHELDMGLRGDLSMSEAMEVLMDSLFDDRVPSRWDTLAWPSLRPLGSWLANMLDRYKQLLEWTADMSTPKVRRPGARPPARRACFALRARLAFSRVSAETASPRFPAHPPSPPPLPPLASWRARATRRV